MTEVEKLEAENKRLRKLFNDPQTVLCAPPARRHVDFKIPVPLWNACCDSGASREETAGQFIKRVLSEATRDD